MTGRHEGQYEPDAVVAARAMDVPLAEFAKLW